MPFRLFSNREDPFIRLLNQTAATVKEGTVALMGALLNYALVPLGLG